MNAVNFTLETVHGVKQSFCLGVLEPKQDPRKPLAGTAETNRENARHDRSLSDAKPLER